MGSLDQMVFQFNKNDQIKLLYKETFDDFIPLVSSCLISDYLRCMDPDILLFKASLW